jgi:hypothetical protein
VKGSLGALAVALVVACPAAAGAGQPATHPYVKVSLATRYTQAQRLAIERRLTTNPSVRSVELLTRTKQLATARRLYRSILPPDDVSSAIRALERKTKGDVLCVRVVSNAAANRLFATYNLRQRGVTSISKFSGGEMLSACTLVDGLEHVRVTVRVEVPPPAG